MWGPSHFVIFQFQKGKKVLLHVAGIRTICAPFRLEAAAAARFARSSPRRLAILVGRLADLRGMVERAPAAGSALPSCLPGTALHAAEARLLMAGVLADAASGEKRRRLLLLLLLLLVVVVVLLLLQDLLLLELEGPLLGLRLRVEEG